MGYVNRTKLVQAVKDVKARGLDASDDATVRARYLELGGLYREAEVEVKKKKNDNKSSKKS